MSLLNFTLNMIYIIHKMLVLVKNHLNYLKLKIVFLNAFFKEYNRLFLFFLIFFFRIYNDEKLTS